MTDHQHTTLAGALAAVQAALPVVHKGKSANVGTYSYTYADLADVTEAIMPLLSRNGLAFTCHPRLTEKGYELAASLIHTSGEKVEGALPLTGSDPQKIGSSITYMRRYLLGAMTGVVTDSDDDARIATEAVNAAARETRRAAAEDSVPRISETQSKRIHAMLRELGRENRDDKLKLATFLTGREITTTADMTTREAKDMIDYLATRLTEKKQAEAEQPTAVPA